MSLGFTSVLTADIVSKFPEYQILNRNLVCMCFILRLAPCFVATARAVLLSALECVRNDSPISFWLACAKIKLSGRCTQSIQFRISAGQGNCSLSSTLTRQEKLINVTQGTRCTLPRHQATGPLSVRVSRDVFQAPAQVVRFRWSGLTSVVYVVSQPQL